MTYTCFIFLACAAVAVARYNPYSPYPIANARDPSLTSGETYHSGNFDKFSSYGSSPKITSFNGNGKPRFRGTYQRQFITEGSFQYNSPRNQVNKKGSNYASIANGGVTYEVPTNDYNQQNGVTNYGTTLTSDYGSAFGFHGFDTRAKYQSNGGTTQLTDYSDGNAYNTINNEIHKNGAYESLSKPSYLDPDGDSIIGEAGVDYPTFDEVPKTTFDCSNQQFPGMYGDTEAHCQVFHICQQDGRQDSFLCPKGSIFNQQNLVCDWWYNVDCGGTSNFYSLNAALYSNSYHNPQMTSYALNLQSNQRGSFYGPSLDFHRSYTSSSASFSVPSSVTY